MANEFMKRKEWPVAHTYLHNVDGQTAVDLISSRVILISAENTLLKDTLWIKIE